MQEYDEGGTDPSTRGEDMPGSSFTSGPDSSVVRRGDVVALPAARAGRCFPTGFTFARLPLDLSRHDIEDIIVNDERVPVASLRPRPWPAICKLDIVSRSRYLSGTGWLAGPQTVITAGHCIRGIQLGGTAISIQVSAGRSGSSSRFETTATRFTALPQWLDNQDSDFDFGAVFLDEPLGNQSGYLQFAALDDASLGAVRLAMAGYPTDLDNGESQWFAENAVCHVTDHRIFYDLDTSHGESGAPVWIPDSTGRQVVVGIHTSGTALTPSSVCAGAANSAIRINEQVRDTIQRWVASPA